MMRECMHCHRQVKVPFYRQKSFKYCSRRCMGLAARRQIQALCETCHSPFIHISARCNSAKYCSSACYHKAQHLKGSVTIECAHCGKSFLTSPSHKRKFCSRACVNKSSHEIWKPSFLTARKGLARRGEIRQCEACGYDKIPAILGIHHKDEDRKNNNRENLEILCPNCHSERHNKHIPHAG
jgi:hypothetical protein